MSISHVPIHTFDPHVWWWEICFTIYTRDKTRNDATDNDGSEEENEILRYKDLLKSFFIVSALIMKFLKGTIIQPAINNCIMNA